MRVFFVFVLLTSGSILISTFLSRQLPQRNLELQDGHVEAMLFAHDFPHVPDFNTKEAVMAEMGYGLFRDQRLSINGQVACVSCHKPEHSFADTRTHSFGLQQTERNTPPTINLFAARWLFWDGRADSLVMQGKMTIESPRNHGISRWHLARQLYLNYQGLYLQVFGSFPKLLVPLFEQSPAEGMAAKIPDPEVPASVRGLWEQYHLESDMLPDEWYDAYADLGEDLQAAVDQVFTNGLRALAQYQRGLLTRDSPFDQYLKRVKDRGLRRALNDDFGQKELRGFDLFVGKAACVKCHSGPLFSDGQFHNTGLARGTRLSLGRLEGLLRWSQHPFACKDEDVFQGCEQELNPDESKLRQALGRMRTPSLRNVALTAPYLHDGSFVRLEELLAAYNQPVQQGLGAFDPRVVGLGLSERELDDLLAFLKSLSSRVEDLSTD